MSHKISVKFALFLSLLLTSLLAAGLYWIDMRGQTLMQQDEVERAASTADTAISSLKSIMLAGRGDTAHGWLERLTAQSSIDFAKIYRPDGVEAFRDLKTVAAVNAFLSEQRFQREAIAGAAHLDTSLQSEFDKVVREGRQSNLHKEGQLTVLYPVRGDQVCLACHGYTQNALRGVLVLSVPTSATTTRMEELLADTMMIFLAMMLLFIAVAVAFFRTQIIRPLMALNAAAETVTRGKLNYRIDSSRKDEFGMVANAFDELVGHVESRIDGEAKQKKRQELLTEAVISLSRQSAKEDILHHVGELAMDMVRARYAMVTYTDMKGEHHLIPLGISEKQAAAISRLPVGKGLLGLFWNGHEPVRINNIASHPASVGFPEGHPPMQSLLGVPLDFAGETLGAIYLSDRTDGCDFDEDDERAIIVLASACAIALANQRNAQSELAVVNRRLLSREIELELINEELSQANEAKSQFLANTSHELRTPLNAIIGFSELLKNPRMGSLTERQSRYVDHVHVSGKRLLTIINDLLDISKIEAGMMMIDEIPCLPGQIASEVLNELIPLASAKQIALTLKDDCSDSEKVILDAGKLHQIIVNLVGNAIKFTPEEGQVEILVRIEKPDANKRSVTVAVRDSGCGIAVEDQEKIFEPFVQASGGLNRVHGGTGLGLALTRRQIHLLGGSIRLESTPDEGSCFSVELPGEAIHVSQDQSITEGLIQDQDMEQVDEMIAEIVPMSGPRPKIVVVDEDTLRTTAVIALMEQQGYEAFASDILNAAEQCESLCAYLIMLGIPADDKQLHHRLEALKTYKETRNLPVILIGGDADAMEFSMGPVGVMEKGIKHQDLLDLISRYCHYIPARTEVPSVLVIDDEATVREFLRDTLVSEGFRVLLARDGKEGIKVAVEREPDMIILDLMMPQISGFDVIRQLNRHPVAAQIPVVIYTAKDLTRAEALHLGQEAERVLIKGANGRGDLLRQLQKMELLYPVRAQLIDPVLNCFNSRYMDRRLEQEASNASRHGLKFSLLFWKIDHYNDYVGNYGERWAIAALKEIMETVQSVTRRGDICARMDEDKFMLFLPGVTTLGVVRVAEKLRLRIRHQRFLLPDDQAGELKASFAAAHFGKDAEDIGGLMQCLAERLAEAVNAGGDVGCYGGDV